MSRHGREGYGLEPWVSRSRPGVQLAVGIGLVAVGSLLIWQTRDFTSGGGNALAGFLLGLLLLVIGAASMLVSGTQTVTVDPRKRLIEIRDSRSIGTKLTVIAFRQVAGISVGNLGKRSNFTNMYYLVLHLNDGREYPLFAPGRFFAGASDCNVVEGWRTRLQEYIASPPLRG